ncbi:MAG TPA: CRTAC1 family protein, partial [Sorangium sp.]|nr:CRTAC1 family protein [Sorangium sp.]
VSELAVGDETRWYTAAATQADVNGDGHIDLVFGNYFIDNSRMFDAHASDAVELQDSFSHAFNAGTNRLYLWKTASSGAAPGVQFKEDSAAFSDEEARAWTLAVGAADLNDDGLPELYFANDYGPDRLFLNRSEDGEVKLKRLEGARGIATPKSKVIGRDSFKGMGVDFADINGDGRFDMFVSNIAEAWALQESHFLWVSTRAPLAVMQDGVAPYEDLGEELGVAHSHWGWDTRFGDFDNDGTSELLQATGFVKGEVNRWPELAEFAIGNDGLVHKPASWPHILPGDDVSGHAPNPFYARLADGRYANIAAELGLDAPYVTRGIATSDVDGDGDLDIAYANQWEPSVLLHNQQKSNNAFLALHILAPPNGADERTTKVLPGHPSSPSQGWPAIGATVRFEVVQGQPRVAQVAGCNGHSGCSSKVVHFGLGEMAAATRIDVTVRWRSTSGTHVETVAVSPGWHTIMLGNDASNSVTK